MDIASIKKESHLIGVALSCNPPENPKHISSIIGIEKSENILPNNKSRFEFIDYPYHLKK